VVADFLNSNATRAVGYTFAALAAVLAGLRDRSDRDERDADRWPVFWFVAAALLALMALGRFVDVERLVTGSGRSLARSEGWYRGRRWAQAVLILVVVTAWTVGMVAAARHHVVQRRRQYLVPAAVLAGLVLFAAVRFVSLHWVDRVIHDQSIAGARVGSLIELGLTVSAIVLATKAAVRGSGTPSSSPPNSRLIESGIAFGARVDSGDVRRRDD
jgi:hypothetical protein